MLRRDPYSFQTFPGGIFDVTIRDVTVLRQKGGPRSEITGYAPDKLIENVCIEGLRYGDMPVTDAAGMGLKTNAHVAGLRFEKARVGRATKVSESKESGESNHSS